MSKRVLCMYSGGADSTGMLYHIFENNLYSEYDLHIHHVSMVSQRKRHIPEQDSVINILRWFKKNYPNRKFLFTKNIIDFNFLAAYVPDDTDVLYFIMAQIPRSCNDTYRKMNVRYEKILIGETKTDLETFAKHDISNIPNLNDPELYHYRAYKIYNTCFEPRIFDPILQIKIKKPEIERPILHLTKYEIMNKLPKELLDMTWTCRDPIFEDDKYKECRKCNSCRDKYRENSWQLT